MPDAPPDMKAIVEWIFPPLQGADIDLIPRLTQGVAMG